MLSTPPAFPRAPAGLPPSRHAPMRLGLLFLLLLTPAASGAANHVVEVGGPHGLRFSPADLTIQVGDSVTWRNLGGSHNVNAPGFFRCANGCDGEGGDGNASSASWEFTRTFNSQATIDYRCDPHVALGMTGVLRVQGSSSSPGTVRLGAASSSIAESGVSATVAVERSGGSDGAVSVQVATSDGSATSGADYTAVQETVSWADGDSATKSVEVPILEDSIEEGSETINVTLSGATGGASIGSPAASTITIRDNDQSAAGSLQFTQSELTASEDGGSATLVVERTDGSDGAVAVGFETAGGSAVEGSDYIAASGQLDWGDGDDAPKQIEVVLVDDVEEEGVETFSVSLSGPTGGASIGDRSTATVSLRDDDLQGCPSNERTLCLGAGERFSATVAWEIRGGDTGVGTAVDIGRADSGLFWFFSADNLELLIKVLDGCGVNDRYWVFFAATTDVRFDVTITDTQAGVEKVYSNPLGQPADAVTDTSAFATCP